MHGKEEKKLSGFGLRKAKGKNGAALPREEREEAGFFSLPNSVWKGEFETCPYRRGRKVTTSIKSQGKGGMGGRKRHVPVKKKKVGALSRSPEERGGVTHWGC